MKCKLYAYKKNEKVDHLGRKQLLKLPAGDYKARYSNNNYKKLHTKHKVDKRFSDSKYKTVVFESSIPTKYYSKEENYEIEHTNYEFDLLIMIVYNFNSFFD